MAEVLASFQTGGVLYRIVEDGNDLVLEKEFRDTMGAMGWVSWTPHGSAVLPMHCLEEELWKLGTHGSRVDTREVARVPPSARGVVTLYELEHERSAPTPCCGVFAMQRYEVIGPLLVPVSGPLAVRVLLGALVCLLYDAVVRGHWPVASTS